MGQEHRVNPRLRFAEYETDARLEQRRFKVTLHELGEGGALLSTDANAVAVGDVIDIAYPVPDAPDEINWMAGRVVRATESDGRLQCGIEHQTSDDDARRTLRDLICHLVLHPDFETRRTGSRLAVTAPVTVDGSPGMLEEVAKGGLLVTADVKLAAGQRAEIQMTFPDGVAETFPVEVVHAEQIVRSGAPRFRAGLAFLSDAAGEPTARIAHVVNRLLTPIWWRQRSPELKGGW